MKHKIGLSVRCPWQMHLLTFLIVVWSWLLSVFLFGFLFFSPRNSISIFLSVIILLSAHVIKWTHYLLSSSSPGEWWSNKSAYFIPPRRHKWTSGPNDIMRLNPRVFLELLGRKGLISIDIAKREGKVLCYFLGRAYVGIKSTWRKAKEGDWESKSPHDTVLASWSSRIWRCSYVD